MKQCYYCDGEYEPKESEAEHTNMFCSTTCEERWDGEYINE